MEIKNKIYNYINVRIRSSKDPYTNLCCYAEKLVHISNTGEVVNLAWKSENPMDINLHSILSTALSYQQTLEI